MKQDVFYKLKNPSSKRAKELLRWANDNGLRTYVTMLDIHKSVARIPSDKNFDTVVNLIGAVAAKFLRVILRKDMNLFGRLTDELVINDILEIGIRSIDADSKEYFICVLLDKKFLNVLKRTYELERVSGGIA